MNKGVLPNIIQVKSELDQELIQLLKSRENIVDFLSKNPDHSDSLYSKAEALLKKSASGQSVIEAEKLIQDINLHVLNICLEDSDKIHVHFRHVTRVLSGFFEDPTNQESLKKITQLYISDLGITSLPTSIANCVNLRVLSLDRNRLQSIPVSIGVIASLRVIDVSNNLLIDIDDTISSLPNLESFDIRHNPVSSDALQKLSLVFQTKSVKFSSDARSKSSFLK